MENRHFKLEDDWNVIYYPEKPAGFGVLIFGDERHFVNEETSFWNQNPGKSQILSKLKEAGYTLFTSNFHGKHWGSPRAVVLGSKLYHFVMKNEILNNKIHIIAEGMGALAAIRLAGELEGKVRSIVLINPILSLKRHLLQEKEHKFFYKKVIREIAEAHMMDNREAERAAHKQGDPRLDIGVPIKIFHILSGGRAYTQSRIAKNVIMAQKGKVQITEAYMLPEKASQLGGEIAKFMSRHEKIL